MALIHYNLYLDDADEADLAMIALLEPHRKKRRVGEFLRRVLDTYARAGQQMIPQIIPPTPVRAYVPPLTPIINAAPMPPPAPAASAAIASTAAKMRASFMRSAQP
ncbi:MAG: hypothetical protein KF716_15070 [Anaerolineae bacterium]|nr:hypothetical protein [Anaerolineae bacterium]